MTITGRAVTQKNAGAPEGGRRNKPMSNVAELAFEAKAPRIIPSDFVGFSDDHRAAMWLGEEIKKAQRGVTTQVVELTPALARVILARNEKNRSVSMLQVDNYRRDIVNGAWAFNGEPLILAKDGRLNDGQHRCMAVVEADTPITVVLVIGVDRATRTTVDQGKTRSPGDYLAMEGHSNTTSLAAAASLIWQWQKYRVVNNSGRARPTKQELLDLVRTTPSIAETLATIDDKGARTVANRSLLTFCQWVIALKAQPKDEARRFISLLTSGEGLRARDPILYVRNRLISERGRLRHDEKAELIFRAWNAWRKREEVTRLTLMGGKLPEVES